jgi:hypothetical protein
VNKAWRKQRARLFAAERPVGASAAPLSRFLDRDADMVGRDFAPLRSRGRRTSRPWLVIMVGALAAALMVASLRVSILRLRYQLSAAVSEETQLLERQRAVTVELRELRNPTRLRKLATELGFARPERVIQLSVPAAGVGESAP